MTFPKLTAILNDNRTIPVALIAAGIGLLTLYSRRQSIDFSQIPPVGTTFLQNLGVE
jgi:hypothetical protein